MDPVSKAQQATQYSGLTPTNRLPSGQFRPGVSGNPQGRPHKKNFTKLCEKLCNRREGQALLAEVMEDILKKRGMAAVLLLREIAERAEGKVTQPVEHSGEINLALSDSMRSARERKTQLLEIVDAA